MTGSDDDPVKRARDRLCQLPPVTLAAQVEELHTEIEHQVGRGRKLQAIVDELNAAGISVSLAVFKTTLQRQRRKQRKPVPTGEPSLSSPRNHVESSPSNSRPPRYHPPTKPTFK